MSIDLNSATWQAVRDHAEKAVEASRDRLEGAHLNASETDIERGRIKALREILALGSDKPKPEIVTNVPY
ncbi:hypothetical protein ACFFTN_01415 [Aminobacter aganoensis]|uniref:Uncharacterized protein n=1 Tax=Aminobacter aganoensis TaxID=83264 RepID=A0A7X0F5G6_9HYPH|nr:hypothetical protein [Aminobacter aganoensis]MBB6353482.1 hypothetical protein [Aminobacter aganoensis]